MSVWFSVRLACLGGLVLAIPLGAQDRGKESPAAGIPANAWPPSGLCRIWLRDVPAGQQPAATDCATAIRNRPNSAQVLFGEVRMAAPSGPSSSSMPARSGVVGQSEPGARGIGGMTRNFVPAGPGQGVSPGRGPEPNTAVRNATVGTTGQPTRVPEPPAPAKVPDKPREIPQS